MTERITYFVDVILPLSIPNTYTYRIPYEMNEIIGEGKRVIVPFGKSKYYTAIIRRIHQEIPEKYTAKYIEGVLDDFPIVTPALFQLWDWISEYYMADLGDVMNAALPSNFKLASETKISLHPEFDGDVDSLSPQEFLILEALELQAELTLKEVAEIVKIKTVQPIIKRLIEKRVAIVSEELNAKYSPKFATFAELNKELVIDENTLSSILNELEESAKNHKQVDALLKLVEQTGFATKNSIPVHKKNLIEAGVSASALKTLDKKGIINLFTAEISRIEDFDDDTNALKSFSSAQQNAYDEISEQFKKRPITLLHGVTSSGKTEIYVKLIQEQMEQGNQVLFLLPEIALTTQLISRLKKYFGNQVGVYHSRFNQNERIEIWNKVLHNADEFRIILGARSAVFLPYRKLGLIIVDEEHENSFKQYDPAPRYNARDTALMMSNLYKAKVLLGSATPSIESYFNAIEGRYGLVELNERFGGVQMPEIMCADLEKETKQKTMKSHFSSFLMQVMEENLEAGKQIILFQNRRGYNPVWSCEMCGWTPQCKNCDVSLTYHKSSNALKCHYCGYFVSPPSSCGSCGSRKLNMIGFGTEKIEDELAIYFPKIVIKRMDLDTTRAKNAYQQIISDFENRQIDVLIGTQMVTKGLDFDNVGLVGVLSADQMLNFPDFRAFERSYHLMSQVAGRAGRKGDRGKVIIQAFDPNHWIIQKVMAHDFKGMYTQEIIERRNFHYPPFFRIIVIRLKHRKKDTLEFGSNVLAKKLKDIFKDRVLGPEIPSIGRVRNFYLMNIRIKFERDASPSKVKQILKAKIDDFLTDHDFRSIRVDIDVDPQ